MITNVRADHLDVMGPAEADAAEALGSTIPRRGVVIVGDDRHGARLRRIAARRRTVYRHAGGTALPDGAMNGFQYFEHEDNVAVALAVIRELSLPDEAALRGMYRVIPDSGACTRRLLKHRDVVIEFNNIFAANDVESTIRVWHRLGLGEPGEGPTVALINVRHDRLARSLHFAEVLGEGLAADHYVLAGDVGGRVRARFEKSAPAGRLRVLAGATPEQVLDVIAGFGGERVRVGGVGNIGGFGHRFLQELESKEEIRC